MRRAHVVTRDDENTRFDGEVERGAVGKARELADPRVRAQRDGQQQPSHLLRQSIDSQPEEVLDGVRHRDVLPDSRRAVIDQLAADLEREEGVAERRVADPAEKLPRDAQPEAVAHPIAPTPERRSRAAPTPAVRAPARVAIPPRAAGQGESRPDRLRAAAQRTSAPRPRARRATGYRPARRGSCPGPPGCEAH